MQEKSADSTAQTLYKNLRPLKNHFQKKATRFLFPVLPAYEEVSHEDYLHICYAIIDVCDAVYMLSDWQQSEGARLEYEYAIEKKKQIIFHKETIEKDE